LISFYQNFSTGEFTCTARKLDEIKRYKMMTLAVCIMLALLGMFYVFAFNFCESRVLNISSYRKESYD
jgi:hypothetical protein